jgi:diguanylate cyclase (GGDEF)-like protein
VTSDPLAELEQARAAERDAREALAACQSARRAERTFNRELRSQIARIQHSQGVLGRHNDVRDLVLELAMDLVDAEKGLLLSAQEPPGDELEVVASFGFEHDPEDSGLARRFAREVIERDTTIREDAPSDDDRHGCADDEVRNLLAIPIYLSDQFGGVIVCANREGGFADLDDEVLVAVGDHAGAVLHNSRLRGDLRNAYLSTIGVLADAIELKDEDLRGHSDNVSRFVLAVADHMEFDPGRREGLVFASLLHDVGKLGISERILLKPGRLTQEERAVIQLHPRIGCELVQRVPALRALAPVILHHHECFDGQGYPSGLKGEAIPLESRIIAVADSFSAIISERPYQAARGVEEACAELQRCAGSQFDPEVVRLFIDEVRRRPPETPERSGSSEVELEEHRAGGEYRVGARSFAITDSVTLLYSLRHFHESVQAEAQVAELQQRPFAVIVATLLNLGDLNRERGFGAGDDALRTVAEHAQTLAGAHRGLAFRASGRRIAMLVPGATQAQAERIATALQRRLLESGDLDAVQVGLGATAWSSGEVAEGIIAHARQAADSAAPVS